MEAINIFAMCALDKNLLRRKEHEAEFGLDSLICLEQGFDSQERCVESKLSEAS